MLSILTTMDVLLTSMLVWTYYDDILLMYPLMVLGNYSWYRVLYTILCYYLIIDHSDVRRVFGQRPHVLYYVTTDGIVYNSYDLPSWKDGVLYILSELCLYITLVVSCIGYDGYIHHFSDTTFQ